jgi:ribosomal protein L24, bacterial/organelle
MHIKKNDLVEVIAGKDYKDADGNKLHKQGIVLKVYPQTNRVLVEGVNMVVKHQKSNGENPGGMIEIEAPIHVSNVQLVDPETNKPTRVRKEIIDGKKVRVAVKSGKAID